MSRCWLGVDAGGSKTHALVLDDDGRIANEARSGAGNPLSAGPSAHRSLIEATKTALGGATPSGAHFGVAGAGRPGDAARIRAFLEDLGLDCRVGLSDDARIAFAAESDPPGAVLVCGTGAIAVAYDKQGGSARAGGHGSAVGDEGSGYWIGREAIRAALRSGDGRGPRTALLERVPAWFDRSDLDAVVSDLYRGEISQGAIAGAARHVVILEDDVARGITERAARELMLCVRAAMQFLEQPPGEVPVVLAGGLLATESPLVELLRMQLAATVPGVRPVVSTRPPAYGAARLARTAGDAPF